MAEAARITVEAASQPDGPEAVIRDQVMWIITATDIVITGQDPTEEAITAEVMEEDTTDKR